MRLLTGQLQNKGPFGPLKIKDSLQSWDSTNFNIYACNSTNNAQKALEK